MKQNRNYLISLIIEMIDDVAFRSSCTLQPSVSSAGDIRDLLTEYEHKHNHWNMFLNTCDERTNICKAEYSASVS